MKPTAHETNAFSSHLELIGTIGGLDEMYDCEQERL